MVLYNSPGPSPRIVRIFLAEKGISLPIKEIDIVGGENRQPAFLARNPAGQLPALETDQGQVITEVPVICEYLEERFPGTPIIGASSDDRAETRMWYRRIDTQIIAPMVMGYRYGEGAAFFTGREPVFRASAGNMKALAQEKLGWLDALLAGKRFVCGDRFTLADIALCSFVDFGTRAGQPLDPKHRNVAQLVERLRERPAFQTEAI